MKFISSEFGQALQLLVMEEVRPLVPVYPTDFWNAIAERNRCASRPSNVLESLKSGAKFEVGYAIIQGQHISITELGVYNDGLIVNTRHTDEADAVMSDFIAWAITEFGFREPETHIPRRFSSNVIVEFDDTLDLAIKGFSTLNRLADDLTTAYGQGVRFHVGRISFGVDPATAIAGVNAPIFIEPRANRPLSEHRYFCGGPLTTAGLVAWLRTFEGAFLAS